MRSKVASALAALVFAAGLAILLYPAASDLWNQARQDRLMGSYQQSVAALPGRDVSALWEAARAYNDALEPSFGDAFTGEQLASEDPYWGLLDPDGTGTMGYLVIPKISVSLPVGHGTGEKVLQSGLGHLAGTSLPVGGAGTHSVIAGHRGLPTALLLTDLDQMTVGDRFYLHVLDDVLAYEVDQVLVVEPNDASALLPEEGEDLVTLLTCTPYGVNTQRLLVRGHRVAYVPGEDEVSVAARVSVGLGWQGKLGIALVALLVAMLVARCVTRRRDSR